MALFDFVAYNILSINNLLSKRFLLYNKFLVEEVNKNLYLGCFPASILPDIIIKFNSSTSLLYFRCNLKPKNISWYTCFWGYSKEYLVGVYMSVAVDNQRCNVCKTHPLAFGKDLFDKYGKRDFNSVKVVRYDSWQ